jgi:shikimate dehydrogenase
MSEEQTKPYAEVIGDPISQSKSPLIHGFWLERLGIDAHYGAYRVTESELAEYLASRRVDPLWRGCNVTMPLKQAILPLLDRVEPQAAEIGAVNTVYRDGDALVGANTDVTGFLEPLRKHLAQSHLFRMARVLGTGGAARAVIAGLRENGFTLVVAGRSVGKARALIKQLGLSGEHYSPPLGHFARPTDFAFDDRQGCLDLVVNASPLGMRGQAPLEFHLSHIPPGSVVYDIVTDPVDTAFLKQARDEGFETIGGLSMLVGQAAAAFEKFFGAAPPREFDAELFESLGG